MYRKKKNPQMAISSYSFLSVHRKPQEPLAGAAGQQPHSVGWIFYCRVKNVEEF